MTDHRELPLGAGLFLIFIGVLTDLAKFGLDFLFGIGFILDPLFLTPLATLIFWIVHLHNDVPMFSGKRAAAAWINLAVSATPVLDVVPDWTAYALYLTFAPRILDTVRDLTS